MGLNLRKSIKIGGGTRVNLSRKGVGVSVGTKGVRVGIGPRGIRTSASIPGTGIYYQRQKSWGKKGYKESASGIRNPIPNGVYIPKTPSSITAFMLSGIIALIISFFFLPMIAIAVILLFIALLKMITNKDFKSAFCIHKAISAYRKGNLKRCRKLCIKSLKYKENEPAKILIESIEHQ